MLNPLACTCRGMRKAPSSQDSDRWNRSDEAFHGRLLQLS